MGRIIFALLALVGLGVVAGVGGYYALKRSDIPYQTLAAKYETAASRYADLPNGVRLHYFDAGKQNGPVLVLLHGFTASAHSWDQWSDRLRQDYHIIAIDLPGHGLTRTPPGYRASAEAFRDTLAEFVRARGLGRFALIGNSLGGRVAWEYALAFPDHVEALVLVDAAGWPDPRAAALLQSPAYHALQDPTLGPLLRDLDQTALLRQGLLAAFANDAMVDDTMVSRYADLSRAPGHRSVLLALQGQVATQSYASPETLAALRMPVLILWGEQDALIPLAHGEQFRDAIQNARLVTFPGVGHLPQEEAPDPSAAALRAFLRTNLDAPDSTATPNPVLAEPPAP